MLSMCDDDENKLTGKIQNDEEEEELEIFKGVLGTYGSTNVADRQEKVVDRLQKASRQASGSQIGMVWNKQAREVYRNAKEVDRQVKEVNGQAKEDDKQTRGPNRRSVKRTGRLGEHTQTQGVEESSRGIQTDKMWLERLGS